MKENKDEWSITYKQIGVVTISFVLGVIVSLLLSNSHTNTTTNFTTTELIGFVMSVILSGASIVLAIAAIALGKSSEQAIMNRSDESIRLQTEVFTKTTDALRAIKSSTDVTEKRIEDIISGRAGDLSKQIAEIATDEAVAGKINVKELEEKIRRSLTQSVDVNEESEAEKQQRQKRRVETRERRDRYLKMHDKLMYSLANNNDVKLFKLGHGTPSTEISPFERYDAIFLKNDSKIAISTFMPLDPDHVMVRSYSDVLSALAIPLEEQNISKLYLIQFEDSEIKQDISPLEQTLTLMKPEISSRIEVVKLSYSDIENWTDSVKL